jgi:hypothetical protein
VPPAAVKVFQACPPPGFCLSMNPFFPASGQGKILIGLTIILIDNGGKCKGFS